MKVYSIEEVRREIKTPSNITVMGKVNSLGDISHGKYNGYVNLSMWPGSFGIGNPFIHVVYHYDSDGGWNPMKFSDLRQDKRRIDVTGKFIPGGDNGCVGTLEAKSFSDHHYSPERQPSEDFVFEFGVH